MVQLKSRTATGPSWRVRDTSIVCCVGYKLLDGLRVNKERLCNHVNTHSVFQLSASGLKRHKPSTGSPPPASHPRVLGLNRPQSNYRPTKDTGTGGHKSPHCVSASVFTSGHSEPLNTFCHTHKSLRWMVARRSFTSLLILLSIYIPALPPPTNKRRLRAHKLLEEDAGSIEGASQLEYLHTHTYTPCFLCSLLWSLKSIKCF